MPTINFDRISSLFETEGLKLSQEQFKMFDLYSEHLVEKNKVMNLTAITDPEEIELKHFLDSCLPLTKVKIPENAKVIDVGTGAGFPGIPLKIMRDDISLTLLDSLLKRVKFLEETAEIIGIKAECIHSRAEDGSRGALREKYDVACARAVARLSVLSEYCLPYVKVGGAFIALKGPGAEDEINESRNAVKLLGGKIEEIIEYTLPNGDGRTLVVIKKVSNTPKKYPRNGINRKK